MATKSTRQSAGILLYHFDERNTLKVLLVHPGGPFHQHKDLGAWSIPKGEFSNDEEPLQAAMREFEEELGSPVPATHFKAMQPVRQKGGKRVLAWAAAGEFDCGGMVSNKCRVEFPYKSGKWISIPEVDRAAWFEIGEAMQKINTAQAAFLEELVLLLADNPSKP